MSRNDGASCSCSRKARVVANLFLLYNKTMRITQEIKTLGLVPGSYVVVGGGVLVALDLLEWDDDIDLCVTPEVFQRLRSAGWQQELWHKKTVLKHGNFDVGIGFSYWTLEQLLEDALVIEDVPFMSLEKLHAWKLAMGREKDKRHLRLIEEYQKNIPPS